MPIWDECYNNTKLLIDHGYDINKTDKNGNTCLHSLCMMNHDIIRHPDTIQLLLDSGINLLKKNNNGDTPLDITKQYPEKNIWLRNLLKKEILMRLTILSTIIQHDVFKKYIMSQFIFLI